jgi:GT2 family glycosyltransferase
MKKPTLSIIIVTYNTKNLTLSCINSIFKYPPDFSFEIIVVDNASKDQTSDAINKKNFKNTTLLLQKTNLGFAKANNIGIKKAKGEHILLLNSDTQVTKNALTNLVSFAQKTSNAGIVVPKLLNSDKSPQPSCFLLPTLIRTLQQYWLGRKNLTQKYTPKSTSPTSIEAAVAAAMLITPQAIKKIGLLDERYFMYFEDLDYCRKTKKTGLKIYYLPQSQIIHHHGSSGNSKTDSKNQWKRLIPSSKIYHGTIKHYLIWFIMFTGQKLARIKK